MFVSVWSCCVTGFGMVEREMPGSVGFLPGEMSGG